MREQRKFARRIVHRISLFHDPHTSHCVGWFAPYNGDSGTHRGRQLTIRGGRIQAHRVLYICATVTARFNSILRCFYQRLVAAGKHRSRTHSVMRKLIVLLIHSDCALD